MNTGPQATTLIPDTTREPIKSTTTTTTTTSTTTTTLKSKIPEPKNLATDASPLNAADITTNEPPTPTTVINGFILPQTSRNLQYLARNGIEVERSGQLPTTLFDVATDNEINVGDETTEKLEATSLIEELESVMEVEDDITTEKVKNLAT